MTRTIRRVLFAFVAVFIGGWVYSLLIVPLVEGGPIKAPIKQLATQPTGSIVSGDASELAEFLPPGAWELQPPKKLQLDQGRVFFQDWEPLPDGRLEVKPFTLVFRERNEVESDGGTTPPKPPLFLRAPEGAVLEFDRPFQQGLGPSGKLIGAVLRGEVTIFRTAGEGEDDALEIKTRNIQIQSQRIFTPHRVEFRMGPHLGSGQSLVIQLLTDRPTAAGKVPKIRGIQSLELVKLDYLSLAVPSKPSAGDKAALAPSPAQPSHLLVNCEGPFVLDMVQENARFQDRVRVAHLDDATQREMESLNCRQLTIEFNESQTSAKASPTLAEAPVESAVVGVGKAPAGKGQLQLRRLVAVGQPAVLHSVERDFHAEAEYLSYDPIDKRIVMRDRDKVLLLHKDLRFEAPSFEYDIEEGSKLGTASAVGAGRMVRIPGTNHAGLDITWQEELQMRPHEGLHALSLYGSPKLRMGKEGQFAAQELHVWLAETRLAADQAATDNSTRIDPVKLLAQGQVKIDSPKLGGNTDRLEVFWDQVAGGVGGMQPSEPGSGVAAPAPPAASGQPVVLDTGGRDREQPERKMIVSGEFIRARLKPDQKSFSVEEITIDGQARLVEQPLGQNRDGEQAPAPLTIAGKLLQVNSLGGNLFAAYVVSEDAQQQTATLAARGMELFGQQLQLNQAQHRMWMDGAGEARLHSVPKQQASAELTGPVIVRWAGGLDFDGQLVRVRDAVSIWLQTTNQEGNLSTVQLQGERLDIRLTQKLDLTASADQSPGTRTGETSKAEVETLILGGKVLITHWETKPGGQWQAVDRLTAMGAGVDYQTGNLLAGGPGVAQSIRLQGAFKGLPGADPKPRDTAGSDKGLTHVRIEYARSIEGNIFEKRMAFVEQVQVFSDDVPTWDSWLEREQLQRSATMIYLRSDQLTLDEVQATRGATASWLVQAVGNAYLTGRGVEASATRMTYDQGKDLLTLVAEGRDDAQLTRQAQPGGPRDHVRAREIKYWRTLNQVEVDGVSSLSSNARLGKSNSSGSQARPGGIR